MTDREMLELIETECVLTDLVKELALDAIYKWVHSHLAQYPGGCGNKHPDWVAEAKKVRNELIKLGELKDPPKGG